MFISIKKYVEICRAISALARRPYLQRIVENDDGTVMFEFVQNGKVYKFFAIKDEIEYEERILN